MNLKPSRRQGRYLRRLARREHLRQARSDAIGSLEDVFAFHKMFRLGKKCCNGVRWKASTQRFELHLFSGTARRRKEVLQGTYKWRRCTHFTLSERGKKRSIDAPHIHDRQIHKVLTKEVLLPLYTPLLIHNNGASLPGKGLAFAQAELVRDLRRHFRRYGMAGHIIITDCRGYFPNADHAVIRGRHRDVVRNPLLRAWLDSVTSAMGWQRGLPLGIEPSQMEMVAYPSKLDSFMKCQLALDGAGHYMDDYYLLVPPGVDPHALFASFEAAAMRHSLTLASNKTRILRFGRPFRFCKHKFTVLATGRILINGSRKSAQRFRRKLKAFGAWLQAGVLGWLDLWACVQSAWNYYGTTNDHSRVLGLRRRFFRMFGFSGERYSTFQTLQAIGGKI